LNENNNITPGTVLTVTADTTPPTFDPHPDVSAEATGPSGAAVTYVSPVATDAVDGVVAVSCAPASGSQFGFGSTTVTCTAADHSGNTATSTFAVVVRDSVGPTISAHADVTVEAASPAGSPVTYTSPAATDAVDGTDPVTCVPASGSIFSLGNTTVTCASQDTHGNPGTPAHFVVHVVDTTKPIIVGTPGDITREAIGPTGAPASWLTP